MRLAVLFVVALAACQSAPTGPVSTGLADAASMHVFSVVTGDDRTAHIPLTMGYTVRLSGKLYTHAGREITPPLHPVDMTFTIAPSTLANAVIADSTLLLFDLTPAAPPGADGSLTITLTESATGTVKSFGPFYILVHPR